jgi:uncharacterized protein YbjT (DUF2867 family)
MILVTGATGNVGSEAARLLALQEEPVRALVRDPARAPQGKVDIFTGDFDQPNTLDAALKDVGTVILVSPAVPAQEIALIDAAVRQQVTHLIKVTSKASPDSPVERRRGQSRIEAHLKASGLPHTLLRSNAYLQNLLALAPMVKQTGGFVMSAGDGEVGMIDARDVAATAARIAVAPNEHSGRTYRLTGPALITYTDVAKEFSLSLGRPVEYRKITPEEHLSLMIRAGLPEAAATSNAQAFELIAEGDAAWLSEDVTSITGTPPRGLAAFVRENLSAFR